MNDQIVKLCLLSVKKLPLFIFLIIGMTILFSLPILNMKEISKIPFFIIVTILPIFLLVYTHKILYPKTALLKTLVNKKTFSALFYYYSGIFMLLSFFILITLCITLLMIGASSFLPISNSSGLPTSLIVTSTAEDPLLLFVIIIDSFGLNKYKTFIEAIIMITHSLILFMVINNIIPSALQRLPLSIKNNYSELFLIYNMLNNPKEIEEIVMLYQNSKWIKHRDLYLSGLGVILYTISIIILFFLSNIFNNGYAYSIFIIFSTIFIFFTNILSFCCSWKAYEEIENYKPRKKREVKIEIDLFDKLKAK